MTLSVRQPNSTTSSRRNRFGSTQSIANSRAQLAEGERTNLSDVRDRLDVDRYESDPGDLLREYTSDDNRLMQLAATEGRQMANRRGMLNSSMAAGASMDAMARTALPLAQQRSEQLENRNVREEGALLDMGMQERGAGFESRLLSQTAQQDLAASRQEFEQESQLQGGRLEVERELAQLDADTRQTLMGMEEGMRVRLAELETDRESYQDATSMVTTFTQQYQDSMRSILSNTQMAAEDRNQLLESAGDMLTLQTDMVRELYGIDITWSGGDFSPVTGTDDGTDDGTGNSAADPADNTTNQGNSFDPSNLWDRDPENQK